MARRRPAESSTCGMTTLVLLPGLDGTGDLFAEFVACLGGNTRVVRYPPRATLGYRELESLAIAALPAEGPYVVLGESFSGPIALSIAARRPQGLCGVVLCCSFARNPRPGWAPLGHLLRLLSVQPPMPAAEWLLAGRFATPRIRQALADALARVPRDVLASRIEAVLQVNVVPALRAIAAPLLYLRATEDRIVPPAASHQLLRNVSSARVRDFTAPHLLLQAVPQQAAEVLDAFMGEVEPR